MELSVPGSGEALVEDDQMLKFYETMCSSVVLVCTELKDTDENGIPDTMIGGGVIVDNTPHILTAAHVVTDNYGRVQFRRCNDLKMLQAKVLGTDFERDLALLTIHDDEKPPPDAPWSFASLAPLESIRVGMQAFTIHHPGLLCFSFAEGNVACGSAGTPRLIEHLIIPGQGSDYKFLSKYPKDLNLIQLNSLHARVHSSGSPVFNSQGRVIGIAVLIINDQDFAVRCDCVDDFFRKAKVNRPRPSTKRHRRRVKRGESSKG